jgi:hypothetical protein
MKTFVTIGAVAVVINVVIGFATQDWFAALGWLMAALYHVPHVIEEFWI